MARITAQLAVLSDSPVPERMIDVLSFVPDGFVYKGSTCSPPRSVPPSHGWFVICRHEGDVSPAEVLSNLLARISSLRDKAAGSRAVDSNARLIIHLSIVPRSTDIPLYFNNELLKSMSDLGADFGIEFFDG
jgi:hypothetical protein